MARSAGLWRKTPTSPWYHRRRVETDAVERLRLLFPSGVIAFTLGTGDLVEAERRNDYAAAFTTDLFYRAKAGQPIPSASEIAEFTHAIQKTGRPPVAAPMAWPIQAYEAEPLASRWYFDMGRRLPVGASGDIVETDIRKWLDKTFGGGPSEHGIFRTWSPDLAGEIACYAADLMDGRDRPGAVTVRDLADLLIELEEKPEDWWKTGDLPHLQDAVVGALERVARRTSAHRTRHPATPEQLATPRISALFDGWKNRRIDPPAPKSVAEAERALNLWTAITGDPPIGTADRMLITEFVETLHALPDSRWKSFSGLSPKQAIAAADLEDTGRERRLSPASVVKFVGLLRSMTDRHVGMPGLIANPFTKAASKDSGSGRRRSLPFSPEEMHAYLNSPIFKGCAKLKPMAARAVPGELIEQDAFYWLALMAPYTGCRREEIGQLSLDDFDDLNGIPYIRLDDADEKHLKTEASRRIVPLHPILVRAGLLDRVAQRKRAEKTDLFDLKPNKLGGRTGSIGSDLNDYLNAVGIKDSRKSFRSFRATAVSQLARIDSDLRRAIFGHEAGERGDVHSASYLNYTVEQRYEAICKIDYGVDPSRFVANRMPG